MDKRQTVDVIIPALNEEKIIKEIVKDSLKIKKYHINVLVVIDNKTKDNTGKNAQAAGATLLHVGENKGKGNAVKKAIPHLNGAYVVQIDADYQFLPIEIPKLVEPLVKNVDVTLGTRYARQSMIKERPVNFFRLFGSYFLSFVTSVFARQRITDVMAGFKGFKTNVLKDLDPQVDHFGYEAELVLKAAKKGYKILNVPITYKARTSGKSNVNSIKHGLLVLQTIIQVGSGLFSKK